MLTHSDNITRLQVTVKRKKIMEVQLLRFDELVLVEKINKRKIVVNTYLSSEVSTTWFFTKKRMLYKVRTTNRGIVCDSYQDLRIVECENLEGGKTKEKLTDPLHDFQQREFSKYCFSND